MKSVTLMRVKRNAKGFVPPGYWEGIIVGLTDTEIDTLKKNPYMEDCFEPVQIKQRSPYVESNPAGDAGETPAAGPDESSLSPREPALDSKT